jgi:hypothetical protein
MSRDAEQAVRYGTSHQSSRRSEAILESSPCDPYQTFKRARAYEGPSHLLTRVRGRGVFPELRTPKSKGLGVSFTSDAY